MSAGPSQLLWWNTSPLKKKVSECYQIYDPAEPHPQHTMILLVYICLREMSGHWPTDKITGCEKAGTYIATSTQTHTSASVSNNA